MAWLSSLADTAPCDSDPAAAEIPEHLKACYRQEGRSQQKINWAEIVAGASVGLIVTVIAHKIIRVTDNG